ncbi:SRPBCC family protein [Haloquadratum walsbyi]|jgi:Uncharacterized conserved protein|uniref:Polyketide cyclase / dehydrase and lipid transport n=1 Tax=Haloquadratum walsbyi J07HQW2 TaxID=1238425 RepID=U1NCV0_9EURY|nr:SRPBCC family protein [Haloquadratum walsbyi]ERG94513.1 MAG: hypothetical protein J07HQW2_00947 [Haloquadratum walsbyi J07HQW2]
MTVRVRRVFEFTVSPSDVWEFIADPSKRADAISVVDTYEVDNSLNTNDDNVPTSATWEVALPIPLIDSTATVDTEDVERDPPTHVKFVGKSSMMNVTGEHTIERNETGDITRLINEFVVDGRVPGVERYFKRNLDDELDNLESALRQSFK